MALFENENINDTPDINKLYFCSRNTKSTGMTLLMKWVLLTAKHIELIDKIREYVELCPHVLNIVNTAGWTALMIAVRNSHLHSTESTVELLIELSANINYQTADGWTALMMAAKHSNCDSTERTVELLIGAGADLNLWTDMGKTALGIAAGLCRRTSTERTVKILLESGADPNVMINDNKTALVYASTLTNISSSNLVVQMLIDYGADVNKRNYHGITVLMAATAAGTRFTGFTETMEGTGFTGTPETVRVLIEAGADPNAVNDKGANALMYAIARGSPKETVDILIDHGTNLNTHTNGMTALSIAVYYYVKYPEYDSVFISKLITSQNINMRDHDNKTPLTIALNQKQLNMSIIKILIDAGAKLDITHKPDIKALQALDKLDPDMVTYLIHQIIETNYGTDQSLINLIEKCDSSIIINIIKTLLQADPNINIDARDANGSTALMAAIKIYGRTIIGDPLVMLLLNAGADMYLKDSNCWDAFAYAFSDGSNSIIRILCNRNAIRSTYVGIELDDSNSFMGLDDGDICVICLAKLDMDKKVVQIRSCSHRYHVGCIGEWLGGNNTCPLCKRVLYKMIG